ncbi:MAG: hypothetical protein AAF533_30620, partial [Acidobacteriota bacterium]
MHPLRAAVEELRRSESFAWTLSHLREGQRGLRVHGAAGPFGPLALALAASELGRDLVLVTPDLRRARVLERDLESLVAWLERPFEVSILPPLEGEPYALIGAHGKVQRERVATLERLGVPRGDEDLLRLLIVPARSLLLPVPSPKELSTTAVELRVGDEEAPADLAERLVESGYSHADLVAAWGEFSHRGSVFDIFPPDTEQPVRVEYWGDEVTEIRHFDPETQRSVGNVDRVVLGAVREAGPDASVAHRFARSIREHPHLDMAPPLIQQVLEALDDEASFPGFETLRWSEQEGVSVLEHLPGALCCCELPDQVDAELRAGRERLEAACPEELRPFLPTPGDILRDHDEVHAEAIDQADLLLPDISWADAVEEDRLDLESRVVTRHGGDLQGFLDELRQHLERGGSAGLVLASEGRLQRMKDVLVEIGLSPHLAWVQDGETGELDELPENTLTLGQGLLAEGARLGGFALHSEADIFGE